MKLGKQSPDLSLYRPPLDCRDGGAGHCLVQMK